MLFLRLFIFTSLAFPAFGGMNNEGLKKHQEIEIPLTKINEQPIRVNKKTPIAKNNLSKPELLKLCHVCHNKRAYENNAFLPILSSQNQSYLKSKINLFKNDERNFHPFSRQLSGLSEDDIDYLSFFYANQPSPLSGSLVVKNVKTKHCLSCHGLDGNGDELIPAISGQNSRYLAYRIREINNKSSNIHTDKSLDINCQLEDVSLSVSNELSRLLSYSITPKALKQGEDIYKQRCSSCHEQFVVKDSSLKSDLTKLSLKQQKKGRYFHATIKAVKANHNSLSQESWEKAFMFLLSKDY